MFHLDKTAIDDFLNNANIITAHNMSIIAARIYHIGSSGITFI